MSAFEYCSIVLQALTFALVVVSAVYVRRQVSVMNAQTAQLQRSLTLTAEVSLDNLFVPVTQAYLDHPELRAVFNPSEAAPRPLDREATLQANAVCEMLLDSMERALAFKDVGLGEAADPLVSWISDSIRDSAFLRTWILNHATWYPGPLLDLARHVEAESQDSSSRT